MSLSRRLGGRRQGADFMLMGPRPGLPILVVGGGKAPDIEQMAFGSRVKLAGVPNGDDITLFWTVMGQELGRKVEFVNGAENIGNVDFMKYSIIAVASDRAGCPSGGLTEFEHDAFSARAADLAAVVGAGRGVIGFVSPWRTRRQRVFEAQPTASVTGFPGSLITRTTYGNYAWLDEIAPGITLRNHYTLDIERIRLHTGPTCPLNTYRMGLFTPYPTANWATAAQGYAIGGVFEEVPYEEDPNVPAPDPGYPELEVHLLNYPVFVGDTYTEQVFCVVRINLGNAQFSVSPDFWSQNGGTVTATLIFTQNTTDFCQGPRMVGVQSDGACGSVQQRYINRTLGVDLRVATQLTRTAAAGNINAFFPFNRFPHQGLTPGASNDMIFLLTADNSLVSPSVNPNVFRFRFGGIGWNHHPRRVDLTPMGVNMGLTKVGMDNSFRLWEQTYTAFPPTLDPFITSGPDFFRYVGQAAGLAGFGTFPGGGSVVLIGQAQEEGIFNSGFTLLRGDFDDYVRIMQHLVDAVERHGVRVQRAPQDPRPWAASEPPPHPEVASGMYSPGSPAV